jgi:hypothetical protein
MKKTLTGVVSTNGGAIYVTPLDKHAEIEYLLFNSPVNYQIKIYKQLKGSAQRSLIYKLELDAGDIITDTSKYMLNPGDSLYAISDSIQTNYTITINEE